MLFLKGLQGRVKFPIGGTVRARDTHDLVQFQNRQYSLDERRENVNKNGGAGKLPDTLPRMMDMADITRLGEISLPKLSENMAPEDRRAINNYLMQLRDQTMYMLRNLDESNFSDAMRDKLTAMGLKGD